MERGDGRENGRTMGNGEGEIKVREKEGNGDGGPEGERTRGSEGGGERREK